MKETLVSAIITTYKRPKEIVARAIKSILAQTYNPIEIIVVDDSPAEWEGRQEIADCVHILCPKAILIQNEKNLGACVSRNRGLHAAKGEFIAYLDDDDEGLPEKIERQLSMFTTDRIGLVYCGSRIIIDEKRERVPKTLFVSENVHERLLCEGNFIGSTSFPLIRTKYLADIGGFDELLQSSQDYDTWIRLSELSDVAFVKEILVNYYSHTGERITLNISKKKAGIERILQKNKAFFLSHQKAKNRVLREIGLAFAGCGKYREAIKFCISNAAKNPRYMYMYFGIISACAKHCIKTIIR